MSGVFFYTFRTNRFVDEIEEALGKKIYIIDRYSKDFDLLVEDIEESGAKKVCGIGISKRYTRFEEKAFNRLGANKIDRNGPDELKLSLPIQSSIQGSRGMTFGPCNYVAYRLAKAFDGDCYFLHLAANDIDKLQAVAF